MDSFKETKIQAIPVHLQEEFCRHRNRLLCHTGSENDFKVIKFVEKYFVIFFYRNSQFLHVDNLLKLFGARVWSATDNFKIIESFFHR